MLLSAIRDIYFVFWSTSSATTIHNKAFNVHSLSFQGIKLLVSRIEQSLMAAPMKFFNEPPIGRVLNRFSKDQDVVIVIHLCHRLLSDKC